MNFTTLNFIHDLLVKEEATRHKAYEIARDAKYAAEDEEAENLPELQAVYDKVRDSWYASRDALQAFEQKDWA